MERIATDSIWAVAAALNEHWLIGLVLALGGMWTLPALHFRRLLAAVWREPVFRMPVMILESDDWGAGPLEQVAALVRLHELLAGTRDSRGEPVVMTVGLILETIDRDATRGAGQYVALALSASEQAQIVRVLRDGERAGVFALQLHGLTHYRPDSLLACARNDASVAAWLDGTGPGWTEMLPPATQSCWTNTTVLPSLPLSKPAVEAHVAAEIAAWRSLFGAVPAVAVPTTFVWTPAVERAWGVAGVRAVVTPGRRYEARGADGAPARVTAQIVNGERGEGGVLFLVRDVYFEPALGHSSTRLADGVLARAALGRPALVEMHRFNFCGPRATSAAYDTLRAALADLLARVPDVRFLSTAALAELVARHDETWLDCSLIKRLAVWARRVRELHDFGRWARMTGLALPLRVLQALA
ncbi:MAG TPA: glycosyl hydrolase [Gammaproteobacteria bacterium]|nr:glycosyl hydrolase [Gammaproteobacteria bacterium]